MKSIYDVQESILDDEYVVLDKVDQSLAMREAAVWLKSHGVPDAISWLEGWNKEPYFYGKWIDDNGVWNLESQDIIITNKDKNIPNSVRVSRVNNLSIQGWPGKTLPLQGTVVIDTLSIRNCPNLVSLEGCSPIVKSFALSGCPKITSLKGAPKGALNMFKAINNGVKFSKKDIKKVCKIADKNMIYDD